MPTYVKVPETNKVYDQSVIDALEVFDVDSITPVTVGGKVYRLSDLKTAIAINPPHWATDIQNLQALAVSEQAQTQAQIDDINNVQIPAKQAEQTDFFTQFPELQ